MGGGRDRRRDGDHSLDALEDLICFGSTELVPAPNSCAHEVGTEVVAV